MIPPARVFLMIAEVVTNFLEILCCSFQLIILKMERSGGNSRPSCPSDVGGGTPENLGAGALEICGKRPGPGCFAQLLQANFVA